MNGILIVNKPSGITSHDVVARIRKFFNTQKVGHAGTLDPLASGVLPVLVGNITSAQDYFMNHDKRYTAGMRMGITTDTGDITGMVSRTSIEFASFDMLDAAAAKLTGEIMQTPPMYSAIKIDGQKMCDLAREGKTVDIEPRKVNVYKFDRIKNVNGCDYLYDIKCSKGTYIRSLFTEMGKLIGCGATMLSLVRTECGKFTLDDAHTLEEIEEIYNQNDTEKLNSLLLSPEELFADLEKAELSEFYSKLCKNGCEIYLEKAKISKNIFASSPLCRVYDSDGALIGIGEISSFPDGEAIKIKYRF